MNGKVPVWLTILGAGILAAAVLTLQPYTAEWPGTEYAQPARRYIHAAIRQDSVRLVELSGSVAPVLWALSAARSHPQTLALWDRRAQAWTGERSGDTIEVFLYPPGQVCGDAPIMFRFLGSGDRARVLRASSSCAELR